MPASGQSYKCQLQTVELKYLLAATQRNWAGDDDNGVHRVPESSQDLIDIHVSASQSQQCHPLRRYCANVLFTGTTL